MVNSAAIREMIITLRESRRYRDIPDTGYAVHALPPFGDLDYVPVSHFTALEWANTLEEFLDVIEKEKQEA